MGIIGDHVSNTTGNAASATKKKEAIEKWNEAVEMIGHAVDKVGGDDPFKTFETVEQIKTLALALLNGVDYSTGQPTLGFAVPSSTPTTQQPTLALGGGSTQTQTQPPAPTDKSDAEKLGERIMKLTGQDLSRASIMVKFLEDSFGIDPNLLSYANQTAAALSRTTNPDELIELPTGEWALKSQQTKAKKVGLYEDAFDELVSLITGSNTTDPVGKELARAKTELAKLMSGTGTASKDDVTKLLDTLAGKLNLTRNGDDNPAFQPKVIKAAEDAQYWSNLYGATRREIISIATAAPFNLTGSLFDVNTGGTSAEIVKEIVKAAAKLPGGADAIREYLEKELHINAASLQGKSADKLFFSFVDYVRVAVEQHYDNLKSAKDGLTGTKVVDGYPLKGKFPKA